LSKFLLIFRNILHSQLLFLFHSSLAALGSLPHPNAVPTTSTATMDPNFKEVPVHRAFNSTQLQTVASELAQPATGHHRNRFPMKIHPRNFTN
jgi:hypothetical protein